MIFPKPLFLWAELLVLFVGAPLLLFFFGTRSTIYWAIWGGGAYAFWNLWRMPGQTLKKIWRGKDWSLQAKKSAYWRFLFLAFLLTLMTLVLVPDKFFSFPQTHFVLWLAVMAFYPVLSIVPQELLFRSFFFARYAPLLGERALLVLASGLLFGFSHVILNNWVAPSFCAAGGLIIASSYREHRSLKWAVIEHSLYGCWIFTVGLGWFFYTGNWR